MSELQSMLANQWEKVRHRQFLEAAMGAAALVATADGRVSAEEIVGRERVLDRLHVLQVFDETDAVAHFRSVCDTIEADADLGSEQVHHSVIQFNSDPALAQLLLRLCVVIAKADLNFSEPERCVVAALCETLGSEQIDLDALPREEPASND